MNAEILKSDALKLKILLVKYEKIDIEAKNLKICLDEIIANAILKKIHRPLEIKEMPSNYFFNEGDLRKYPDLEEAYSKFFIGVTGGISPEIANILDEIRKKMFPYKR
jgi:hypothetical protein